MASQSFLKAAVFFTGFWRFSKQTIARLYLESLTCQRQAWVPHFKSDGGVIASLAGGKEEKEELDG